MFAPFPAFAGRFALHVATQPVSEGFFIEFSCRQSKHCLCGIFFTSAQTKTIHFQEQYPQKKPGSLISVEEGMVADDACGVGSRQFYDVGIIAIGVNLLRTGEGRLQKAFIAHARCSAVDGEKASVERKSIALVDPNQVAHLESACRVLR